MNYEDYTHHNHHSGFGEYQGDFGLALPSDGGKKAEYRCRGVQLQP